MLSLLSTRIGLNLYSTQIERLNSAIYLFDIRGAVSTPHDTKRSTLTGNEELELPSHLAGSSLRSLSVGRVLFS